MLNTDLTVLIVESNRATAEVLRLRFEMAGFSTVIAGSGVEAVGELESGSFDLIVTELMLPDMNCSELCETVRDVMGLDDLAIIVCSPNGMEADISALVVNYGISKVFFKPVAPKTVVASARELLYRSSVPLSLATASVH